MEDYQAIINKRMILITNEDEFDFRLQYNLDTEVNLNDTAKFIIKNCNRNKSVNEIVQLILKEYRLSNNMEVTVYNDVIAVLSKLWDLGVIKWKHKIPNNDNFCEQHNKYLIKEMTIQDDTEILRKYPSFLWNAYTNLEAENNLNTISMQLITKTTRFYQIMDLESGVEINISLQFDDFSNQVIFKGIYCKEEKILNFKFQDVLKWIVIREIHKSNTSLLLLDRIPILFFSSNRKLSQILDLLDFEEIGLLRNEVNYDDVSVYITYVPNNDFS